MGNDNGGRGEKGGRLAGRQIGRKEEQGIVSKEGWPEKKEKRKKLKITEGMGIKKKHKKIKKREQR